VVLSRLLRIQRTAHRISGSILEELNVNKRLSTVGIQNILKCFGPVSIGKMIMIWKYS